MILSEKEADIHPLRCCLLITIYIEIAEAKKTTTCVGSRTKEKSFPRSFFIMILVLVSFPRRGGSNFVRVSV